LKKLLLITHFKHTHTHKSMSNTCNRQWQKQNQETEKLIISRKKNTTMPVIIIDSLQNNN